MEINCKTEARRGESEEFNIRTRISCKHEPCEFSPPGSTRRGAILGRPRISRRSTDLLFADDLSFEWGFPSSLCAFRIEISARAIFVDSPHPSHVPTPGVEWIDKRDIQARKNEVLGVPDGTGIYLFIFYIRRE